MRNEKNNECKKIITVGGKNFEVPKGSLCCGECGTVNFIYDDMKPPYKCDDCGTELDAASMEEIDMEGKYDNEI